MMSQNVRIMSDTWLGIPPETVILQPYHEFFTYKDIAMLELRPSCECCDLKLPPDSPEARICTFECTFCRDCVDNILHGVCPNCGGNFVPRPIRPASKLGKYPPSQHRVFNPECKKT